METYLGLSLLAYAILIGIWIWYFDYYKKYKE